VDDAGHTVSYTLHPKPQGGREGNFLSETDELETPHYVFRKGLSSKREGEAFFVQYEANISLRLTLEVESPPEEGVRNKENILAWDLPPTNSHAELQVPLKKGERIKAFWVTSDDPEAKVSVLRAGITDSFHGVRLGDPVVMGDGILVYASKESTYMREFVFPKAIAGDLSVELTYKGIQNDTDSGMATITLMGRGQKQEFTVELFPQGALNKGGKIYIHPAMCRFGFDALRVESDEPGFSLESLLLVPVAVDDPFMPLPADLGTLLLYDPEYWRNPDFELFSWTRFPGILLIDTRNYDVQSRFFKRIAFFVEKKGFAGRLLDDGTMEPLHGWNAHDYRAFDLAAFFDRAFKEQFPLCNEERILFELLKRNGVVRETGMGIEPGSGGILSVSQESERSLRRVFLVHEGYHGVFFSDTAYADAVNEVWEDLSEGEKQFWSSFLSSKQYNVLDPYLLVNEFQAYLMQQSPESADSYYKNYIIPQMIANDPKLAPVLKDFIERYPDTFVKSARAVSASAKSTVGVAAGDLLGIRPAD